MGGKGKNTAIWARYSHVARIPSDFKVRFLSPESTDHDVGGPEAGFRYRMDNGGISDITPQIRHH